MISKTKLCYESAEFKVLYIFHPEEKGNWDEEGVEEYSELVKVFYSGQVVSQNLLHDLGVWQYLEQQLNE